MTYLRKISTCLFLILFLNPVVHPEDLKHKNILVLFAMSSSTPAYRTMLDEINANLTKAFRDDYTLHTEYLEIENYPRGAYPRDKFELYNEKYDDVRLDLLLCVGVDITETVRAFADKHLLAPPAICVDFDFSGYGFPSDISLNDKTTQITVKVASEKTISAAISLFPERDSIFFICGISKADKLMCAVAETGSEKACTGKKVTFLKDMSMDDVIKKVRKLGDHDLVIVPNFNTDGRQVRYYNPEAVRIISKESNAPVFSFTDVAFGEGVIGGYLISYKKLSVLMGTSAVRILEGTDPASIIVSESDYYENIFDWRQLKRWNLLDSKLLPKDRHIEFEEITFFGKYKLLIIAILIFLALQSLLIFNLIRLNRKQRMMTRQLIETRSKFSDLVREDRILRVGQLTATLSHELNQPLTAILSTAQAGLRFMDSENLDPALMKELFQNIVEDDKRTASILSSIRGMMKLENREKEKVDLNELISEMVVICRAEADIRSISLLVSLTGMPVYIFADRIQIQQVLMNLIMNAVQSVEKISRSHKIVDIVEVTENEYVTVSVRDHGLGIDPNLKDQIFKPFVSSKKEGSGIGLAISRSIIEYHHGRIWCENLLEGGAVFSFSLKVYKDE